VNGAVVLDVNLGAGFGDDALDGLAARSDECADLIGLILMVSMRGAYLLRSSRGLSIAFAMISRILVRASFVLKVASAMILWLTPRSLRSSWNPVIPCSVPQTL
jgi:hypothetical protein